VTRFILHVDLDTGDLDATELMGDVEEAAYIGLRPYGAKVECIDAVEPEGGEQ
jgi:hypothetical protein